MMPGGGELVQRVVDVARETGMPAVRASWNSSSAVTCLGAVSRRSAAATAAGG
jgi:hypothetical protein